MFAVRVAVLAAGLVLTVWTVMSAVRTVILPRSVQSVLNGIVMKPLSRTMRAIAGLRPAFSWRDRVMAYFGPLAMLALVMM